MTFSEQICQEINRKFYFDDFVLTNLFYTKDGIKMEICDGLAIANIMTILIAAMYFKLLILLIFCLRFYINKLTQYICAADFLHINGARKAYILSRAPTELNKLVAKQRIK